MVNDDGGHSGGLGSGHSGSQGAARGRGPGNGRGPGDGRSASNGRSATSPAVLSNRVYEDVLARIMDGSLEPGTPLRIGAIAQRVGVSQTPVREGLVRLEATGLIRHLPLRGYIVAPPLGPDELAHLTDARALLEPEIVAQAVRRAEPTLIARLEASQHAARAAPTGPTYRDYAPYLRASADFHAILTAACANPYLAAAVTNLPVHVQRFRLFGAGGVSDAAVSIAEHERILAAVIAKDPVAARQAMADHIQAVHSRATATP